jgi:lipopolysaccharide transport system ATP-binding protein
VSEVVILAKDLCKRYSITGSRLPYRTLRESVVSAANSALQRLRDSQSSSDKPDIVQALEDVSFQVVCGEVVGIVGRNGAGKSTLLKILSRITRPTSGWAQVHGRVGSLLEVGTGFHPELTGRENIYLNGAILGMKRSEIARKFDEIVAFAEIEKFLDTPVKRYSSGMYTRLAFSVAAHLEPEILLVDEVLAVGDAAFQRKCIGKIGAVAKEGRTVLFVSHNLRAITGLCKRAIWIDQGRIRQNGPADCVVEQYILAEAPAIGGWIRPPDAQPAKELELLKACILQDRLVSQGVVSGNNAFQVEIEYEVRSELEDCSVIFRLEDMNGVAIFTSWDSDSEADLGRCREPGRYRSACTVPAHFLRPARYTVTVGAHIPRAKMLDWQENAFTFEVSEVGIKLNRDRQGVICPLFDWTITRV